MVLEQGRLWLGKDRRGEVCFQDSFLPQGGTGAIAGELGVTCSGSGEAGCDFSKLPATGDEAAVPETPIGVFH